MTSRVVIDDAELLKPIPGESEVGKWFHYEPIYDEIRQARSHEDARLSQGVWEHEPKRAEWEKVEGLCTRLLLNETKDLQVVGWLTESWTALDGIRGFIRGVDLLRAFAEKFWASAYPYPEDPEARQSLFTWFDNALSKQMFFFTITYPEEHYNELPWTLAEWRQAQRIGQITKRTNNPTRELERAREAGEPTMPQFELSVARTENAFFKDALKLLDNSKEALKALKDFLTVHLGTEAPSFSQLEESFKDFKQIWEKSYEATQKAPSPPQQQQTAPATPIHPPNTPAPYDTVSTTRDREHAYQQLKNIADLLGHLEPQSIAPYLLLKIVAWKDKNFPEILQMLSKSPAEYALLLQLLSNSSGKNNEISRVND